MRFRKFFIHLLILSVFISGNGLVLSVHTCLASSTKTVSVFESNCCNDIHSKPCNGDKKEHLKSTCCVSQFSYYKLNLPGTTEKIKVTDNLLPAFHTIVFRTTDIPVTFSVPEKSPPNIQDIPILFNQLLI